MVSARFPFPFPKAVFLSALLVFFYFLPLAQARQASWKRTGETTGRLLNTDRIFQHSRFTNTQAGETLLFDLNLAPIAPNQPILVEIRPMLEETAVEVLTSDGRKVPVNIEAGGSYVEVRAGEHEFQPFEGLSFTVPKEEVATLERIVIKNRGTLPLEEVTVRYTPFSLTERINLAPAIARPKHQPRPSPPVVTVADDRFVLENGYQKATFSTGDGLRLISLESRFSGKNLLKHPEATHLFMTEADGQRHGAERWKVTEVRQSDDAPESKAVQVNLRNGDLEALFSATATAAELKLGLSIRNLSGQKKAWKTLFPHLGGLILSQTIADDYYLFPYYGGIIHSTNAHLRSLYSIGSAWWQMVDLYSPAEGFGVALWCLDPDGLPKGIAFRKGKTTPAFARLIVGEENTMVSPDYFWKESLEAVEGSSFAIEYPQARCAGGETIVYPESVLAVHPGDWKKPMQRYADWAKKTWKWRPMSDKLKNAWNQQMITMLSPPYKNQKSLYKEGTWYADYRKDHIDMGEFGYWWEWSEKGPFGASLDPGKVKEEVGEKVYTRFRSFFNQKEEGTGKRVYKVNDGDYDYNPAMGGLEGLRTGIAKAHEAQVPVQFYTTPFLADANTRLGREYGRKFNVMIPYLSERPADNLPAAPRGQHFISFGKWRMCLDIAQYQEMVAGNRARIARDTGVDCIRLDVLGTGGYPCFNPEHEHLIARDGDDLSTMRASRLLVEKIRAAAAREGRPDLLIAAEYPGADFLAATLDSSLGYEMDNWSPAGLRPVPVNLLRFYFPGFKYFDLLHPNRENRKFPAIPFWNAVGVRGKQYQPALHRILRENSDALSSDSVEPLVPTLVEEVYANRFTGADKTVTLLYNALETESDGPTLPAKESEKHRYFNLIDRKELVVDDNALGLKIAPGAVAAIARFNRTLKVTREEETLTVELLRPLPEARLVVIDPEGRTLAEPPLQEGKTAFTPPSWQAGSVVQLFSGHDLKDAVSLPTP